jgi:hypothetical protein
MPAERTPLLSRLSLILAVAAVILATTWALRTAPQPNSDRYDYLARAWHLSEGKEPAPLVVYPLRLAFPEADSLPPRNLTRPPLWPAILSVPMRAGMTDSSAVVCAALALAGIVFLLWRATPDGLGGFAALATVGAYSSWRALLGGGPELALGLLLLVVWTWTGTPQRWTRTAVLGGLLGLMPWLHPVGWLYALLGLGSRLWREPAGTLLPAALLALVIALPWYTQSGNVTGELLAPLQGHAELQKAVHDGGGLGPYRTLETVTAIEVVAADPGRFVRHVGHNLKELLLRLDGWMAWPMVLIGLFGIRRDRWLAVRDLLLVGIAFLVVASIAFDPRLLTPLVPVAALWVGAGAASVARSNRSAAWAASLPLLVVLPWIIPLGATARPGTELRDFDLALRDPDRRTVVAYGTAGIAGSPCFTDSSVLAWRARRTGIAIPQTPEILDRLAESPAVGADPVLVASGGNESWWFEDAAWSSWWDGRDPVALIATPRGLITGLGKKVYVPEPLALGVADAPDSLATIPPPIAVREGLQLHPTALRSLQAMVAAALRDGVHLRVTSAYRSWQRQAELHASAIARYGPEQRWVAAPGTSEHQLGTTVDFCDAAMQQVLEPGFAGTDEGQWLAERAHEFGWIRSYTTENAEFTGYEPEPWHYRYEVIRQGGVR